MNSTDQTSDPDAIDIAQLARAIRFALVAFVLGLSYFSIRISFCIGSFDRIYNDMLNGKPLPIATHILVTASPLFMLLSVAVPFAALATLGMRRAVPSFYILGVLGLLSLCQSIFVYESLLAPLLDIIRGAGPGT